MTEEEREKLRQALREKWDVGTAESKA
jgi:hypothetical protein